MVLILSLSLSVVLFQSLHKPCWVAVCVCVYLCSAFVETTQQIIYTAIHIDILFEWESEEKTVSSNILRCVEFATVKQIYIYSEGMQRSLHGLPLSSLCKNQI